MKTSDNGIKLITSFEGCKLSAYQDAAGVWTIGFGHTGRVYPGMVIDSDTAITLFKEDLKRFENNVNKFMPIYHFTQNQFDAMVSYAYNIGSINKLVDNGKRTLQEISDDIPNHNKAGGKILKGLTRRRLAEKELFDKDLPKNNVTKKDNLPATLHSPNIKYFPACDKSFNSIVMALKSLNAPNSLEYRKHIAAINNIQNYTGTAEQNEKMLKLLKKGKLIIP